jgi:hypothetical protein
MDPLSPKDPLWKLLGKSREITPRPDFIREVLDAARELPQEGVGWRRAIAGVSRWQQQIPVGVRWGAAAAAIAVVSWFALSTPDSSQPVLAGGDVSRVEAVMEPHIVEAPLIPDVESHLESLDYLEGLLALEDTQTFTDADLAYLLSY